MTPISREVCEKHFDHCEKIINLAEQIRDKIPDKESNKYHHWVISGMFQKACKTSQAILMLMKKGYSEDAYSLLRSLMELTFNLGWILENEIDEEKIDRCRQFIDEVEFSRCNQLHRMLRFKEKMLSSEKEQQNINNLSKYIETLKEMIEKRQPQIKNLEKKYRVKSKKYKGKVLPHISKRAENAGLELEYLAPYWMASDFVHSSAVSLNQFLAFDEIGPGIILGENYELVPNISIDLIRFLLGIANAVNDELKLGMEELIKEHQDYFVELLHPARSVSE